MRSVSESLHVTRSRYTPETLRLDAKLKNRAPFEIWALRQLQCWTAEDGGCLLISSYMKYNFWAK